MPFAFVRRSLTLGAAAIVLTSCGQDVEHTNAEIMSGPSKFLTKEQVREVIAKAGFSPSESNIMFCIAFAESSFDALALSYAGARGLFQIMPFHVGELCPKISLDDLWNPQVNANCARKVFLVQGFNAWDPYYFAQHNPSSPIAKQYLKCRNGGI